MTQRVLQIREDSASLFREKAVLTIRKKTVSITNKVMILDSLDNPILLTFQIPCDLGRSWGFANDEMPLLHS